MTAQPSLDETVERTRNARGKPAFDVYEQVTLKAPLQLVEGDDTSVLDTGTKILVGIKANVQSTSAERACWKVAEGELSERALSDDPPVLTAANSRKDAGLSEPRAYALERAVQRRKT